MFRLNFVNKSRNFTKLFARVRDCESTTVEGYRVSERKILRRKSIRFYSTRVRVYGRRSSSRRFQRLEKKTQDPRRTPLRGPRRSGRVDRKRRRHRPFYLPSLRIRARPSKHMAVVPKVQRYLCDTNTAHGRHSRFAVLKKWTSRRDENSDRPSRRLGEKDGSYNTVTSYGKCDYRFYEVDSPPRWSSSSSVRYVSSGDGFFSKYAVIL